MPNQPRGSFPDFRTFFETFFGLFGNPAPGDIFETFLGDLLGFGPESDCLPLPGPRTLNSMNAFPSLNEEHFLN